MRTTDGFVPPSGWARHLLRELCESIQAGPSRHEEDRGRTGADDGVPLVLPRDLHGRRILIEDAAAVPAVSSDRARRLGKYRLAEGDILVTRTGTVGRCAVVTGEHAGWLFHPNLVRLRLPGEFRRVSAAYLTAYLSATAAQEWIRTRTTGAVIPSLSIRTLGELPVLLPPVAEQEMIGATLAALDAKIQAHTEIARATGEYRGVLADALLSGVLPAQP